MPQGWRTYGLGEVTENYDSRRIPVKKADRKPGPYPYYGASGVVDHVGEYLFDGEYLLIAEDGENLRTRQTPVAFLANGRFWVNNHAHIVRGNSLANTRYLSYLLAKTDISGYLTGSTMPKLTQRSMNRIPLLLPERRDQDETVAVLGALDDKIELNRRMNETLEATARAIFKSWFVDFDPVRAKAAGRAPEGLDPATAALFPDEFEDSPPGEIPAGWRVGKVEELLDLSRDSVSPGRTPDEVFDHYSIPAFDEGCWPKGEPGSEIKSNKNLVPEGAVLLSKLNPRIPRVWMPAGGGGRRAIASTEYLLALPREGTTREYLCSLFRSCGFMDVFATLVTGTSGSHQRVKPEHLLNMDVVAPPAPVVARFTVRARPVHGRVAANLEESRTLAAIRDALLPKLLSGELRTTEREGHRGTI